MSCRAVQWGWPTFSASLSASMCVMVVLNVVDAVSDFYATARMCGAPPPPAHAVNRGVMLDGLCSALTGALGSGDATATYSENIAALAITRVRPAVTSTTLT